MHYVNTIFFFYVEIDIYTRKIPNRHMHFESPQTDAEREQE